jgi:predicted transcriptional regulator
MSRRNDLDICADILEVSRDGAKKTHIVYGANLNFNIVKKYLQKLMDKGFLSQTEGSCFVTTEKGTQFLEKYHNLIIPLKS